MYSMHSEIFSSVQKLLETLKEFKGRGGITDAVQSLEGDILVNNAYMFWKKTKKCTNKCKDFSYDYLCMLLRLQVNVNTALNEVRRGTYP